MKKLTTVLAALCLALYLLPAPALAAGITYELEDPGMSITLPEGLVVFRSEMTDDELAEYGFTTEDVRELLESELIRLDAMDADLSYEIVVTSMHSDISFVSELDDALFEDFESAAVEACEAIGITCTDTDVYMHKQTKFMKLHHNHMVGDTEFHSVQYTTAYDGKHINIALHSATGELTPEQEELAAGIVDSIHFYADPPAVETPVQTPLRTEAFKYTDDKTGLSFTVPEKWVEREIGKTDVSVYTSTPHLIRGP